jgi:hypothetical protein
MHARIIVQHLLPIEAAARPVDDDHAAGLGAADPAEAGVREL